MGLSEKMGKLKEVEKEGVCKKWANNFFVFESLSVNFSSCGCLLRWKESTNGTIHEQYLKNLPTWFSQSYILSPHLLFRPSQLFFRWTWALHLTFRVMKLVSK